jgi:hypothetical protein
VPCVRPVRPWWYLASWSPFLLPACGFRGRHATQPVELCAVRAATLCAESVLCIPHSPHNWP